MAEQYLGGRQIKYRLHPVVTGADPAAVILDEVRLRAILHETPVPVFATT